MCKGVISLCRDKSMPKSHYKPRDLLNHTTTNPFKAFFIKADLISCYAKSIGHDAGFYAAWYELMVNTAECLEDEKSLLGT